MGAGPVGIRFRPCPSERLYSCQGNAPTTTLQAAAGSPEAEQIRSLVAAVGPMLWGLEQSVDHLGAMAASDTALIPHVQKLRLLQAVLKRLTG